MKSFVLYLVSIICVSIGTGCSGNDASNKPPSRKRVCENQPKETLEYLLDDYRAYRLPMPPENAPLVKFDTGTGGYGERGRITIYHFGFLLKNASESGESIILVGTRQYKITGEEPTLTQVEPVLEEIDNVSTEFHNARFGINTGLATAIQCYSRGWKEFARGLLQKSMEEAASLPFYSYCRSAVGIPRIYFRHEALTPRTALAFMAWAHWGNELVEPGTDRAFIYQRMKSLLAAEPKLVTDETRDFLKSLAATLAPSTAKPNSAEALIDGLSELTTLEYLRGDDKVQDPTYEKLVLLCFDGIPALINHLDDQRLTRIAGQDHYKLPPYIRRVKDIVSDLLMKLAGDDLSRSSGPDNARLGAKEAAKLLEEHGAVSLSVGKKWYVNKTNAVAWWEKIQAVGEEQYLLENVFPKDPQREWPNTIILQVLAHKYPQHLPNLYRKLLDERPHMQSWPLVEAIAKSNLSREQKMELFTYAGRHSNLEHRRAAFWELKNLDHERFVTMLIETLRGLPETPKEPYWTCLEASFTQLVMQTTDPRAWKMLKEVAKRSDVGLRMEILNRMNYSIRMNCEKQQRLDLLAEFLDDEAVPDVEGNPEMFEGIHASFGFPRLSVQNLAAKIAASILDLKVKPEPDWTAKQWAKLRALVREKLKGK